MSVWCRYTQSLKNCYAPDYIKKINEFSSDISTASLDLGTKIMLPNSDSEGKDSVDLIRDSLFSIQVEQPWLLLQFGNSNAEEIGTDRVEALVSASPEDEDGKTREEVVKTEIEDNDNNNLTIPQVVNRLGMVFFLLFFNLGITIFVFLLGENISLSLVINKQNPTDIEKRVHAIADKLGIRDILSKFPYEVSGGQKQRCACARALINEPKLILADEPTGALDSKASRLLLETMSEINKKMQATILMVTHDPFSASFCERILFLKDGKIFNEIFRGEKSRKDFFNEILDILTLLGGEVGNVR